VEAPESDGRALHPAVEQAARLLVNESEAVKLEALGEAVGLSGSRLSRLFRKQTGVSLVEFRQKQQLDRFLRTYQREKEWTMMAAALRAGFGSYPQFHRVFKARMGCGPREFYRRG
jgi:AraC-like DNA-binding protein